MAATPNHGTYVSSTGVWTIGTVTPGTPDVLKLQTTYTGPGAVENTSSVTHSDQFDPNTGNNSASQMVPVTMTQTTVASSANPSARPAVTFTATVQPVPDGGTVRFAIDGSYVGDPVTLNAAGQAVLPGDLVARGRIAQGRRHLLGRCELRCRTLADPDPGGQEPDDAGWHPAHEPERTKGADGTVRSFRSFRPLGPTPGGGQRLVSIRSLTIDPSAFAAGFERPQRASGLEPRRRHRGHLHVEHGG